MRLLFKIIMFLSIVNAIPKKQILIQDNFNPQIIDQDVQLNQVELSLSQNNMSQINQKSELKSVNINLMQIKASILKEFSDLFNSFELFLSKQQQIGILLVCLICYAFYLMIRSEDLNFKQRKQNIKRKQQNCQQDAIVQILNESLLVKEQSPLPLISTINGSIDFEERVNKSADQVKNNKSLTSFKRSNSQPNFQQNLPDYSTEEINSLLKFIN